MNREKRNATAPAKYEIPLVCYPRVRERTRKKVKPKPCKYETIPLPLKYAFVGGVYHFYGGVSLREHNGILTTEEVMLSYFKCEEVNVIKKQDQKIVNLKLQKPPAFQYPPWQPMVEKLKESENQDLRDWGKLTENYCLKFEDWLRGISDREEFLKRWSKADLIKMTEEAEKKKAEYFSKYPCFTCVAAGEIKQLDITVNEAYLAYAGYDLESFATTTLRDGLPQLLPRNYINPVRLYMENFKSSGVNECITPELELELAVRKGYNRKINCKTHFFFTYKDGNFAAELAYVIMDKGQPNLYTPAIPAPPLNKKFLKKAKKQEKQASQFLEKFYNTHFLSGYANADKVCGIKELPPDDSSSN